MTAAMSCCPEPSILVPAGVEGTVRHPVAAEVQGDDAELLDESAVDLVPPAHVVPRPAVDQEHGRTVGWPPFPHVQGAAPSPPGTVWTVASDNVPSVVVMAGSLLWAARTIRELREAWVAPLAADYRRPFRGLTLT